MGKLFGRSAIALRVLDYAVHSDFVIFADNIHDKLEVSSDDLVGEETLLRQVLAQKHAGTFVYFSTCDVADISLAKEPYVAHKTKMEALVRSMPTDFVIFRVPEVVSYFDGSSGQLDRMVRSALTGQLLEQSRWQQVNALDVDDIYVLIKHYLEQSSSSRSTIDIRNPTSVSLSSTIIRSDDEVTISIETGPGSDTSDTPAETAALLGVQFDAEYYERLVRKNYQHLWMKRKTISIVVPTYNEERGIEEFYRRTKIVLDCLINRFAYEIIFVNDHSTDGTADKIARLAQDDPNVRVLNFSRNFGNQIGITAGIDHAIGDIAVVIDDDLQDPPELIINMIALWDKGAHVVYGVRPKRRTVNPIFKLVARAYYRVISWLSDTAIPNDTGDFRLIDRLVIEALRGMREENRYYRGLVAWVGYKQVGLLYERDRRYAGVSTFSFKKYVNFAMSGLTSFSDRPLYFSASMGLAVTFIAFLLTFYLILSYILDPGVVLPGWTSLAVLTLFFGGVQLMSVGILGVYVAKIYREVRRRPLYLVESALNIVPQSDQDD